MMRKLEKSSTWTIKDTSGRNTLTTGFSLSDQQIFSPINPKTDFVRFTNIYANSSEIQNTINFKTICAILCKYEKNIFRLIGDKTC